MKFSVGEGGGNVSSAGKPTASRIAALEDQLRSKTSLEDTQRHYEADLRGLADAIVTLIAGLTWRLQDHGRRTCDGEYVDTRGTQIYWYALFNGPVPDDQWSSAVQLVTDNAARCGATNLTVVVDEPGEHGVVLTGPDGLEFEFGTKVRTILSAKSGCRISQTHP